jgi:hypothetical protein
MRPPDVGGRGTLQGREAQHAGAVGGEQPLHDAAAEAALAVVEDEPHDAVLSSRGRRLNRARRVVSRGRRLR